MSIRSHPFGGVLLTGEDAKAFLRQIHSGERNKAAERSLQRGLIMMDEYKQTGRVRLAIPVSYPDLPTEE